jgi:uracil-DNA glycosylase
VHETGIPWNDRSGEQLRDWLRMDRAQFYDASHIAVVPAGLCYPGSGKRGDLPPRALGSRRKHTLAQTVRAYRKYLPEFFPLPHPSPRNRLWMRNNPWFAKQIVPALRRRLRTL